MDFIINDIAPFVKNHPLLSLGWIALLIVIIYLTVKSKLSKVKTVSNAQAINMMNKQNAVIVDLRSADNFKKGHITEALNILPIDIKNGSIKSLEKYKELPVILVDDNGMLVNASGDILVKQGFGHVFALKDGIVGWNGENLPLVKK
ncbi:rhodanese-like domain-containing protein [Orbus sturtevantii]|uniref:rhodanese-like domain-containing protein n=1 Tax=Orbus sturtevantii TaxID=3074109 RepID=UPI00370D5FA4